MSTTYPKPVASSRALSRRELLGYAWLVSLVAAVGVGVRAGLRFARPRPRSGEFGGVLSIGLAEELAAPGSAPVSVPAGRFWLVNTDSGVLALHKACTHLDCLLDWDDQNLQFVCPCHGSRFAADGTHLAGPATRSLDRFVVQVVAPTGEIIAETDPDLGAPVPLASQSNSGLTVSDANIAEAEEDEASADDPGYVILVDTGRKILGATSGRG